MQNAHETIAAFVCEMTGEPQKINIEHVENRPGVHFIRFPARLQTYNVWNRNNRNYFLAPMKKSWEAPHLKELLMRGDLFGENGHPDSDNPKRIVTIDPKVSCHRITRYWFQGDSVYGDIETLNDDLYGKQFMMHVLQRCEAAFSLRALVPLTKIDAVKCEIRSPGHIITVDRVILPSHNDAYQQDAPITLVKSTQALEAAGVPVITGPQSDLTVPVIESAEWIDYLKDESFNLKTVIENFEVTAETMKYDKGTDTVMIQEAADETGVKRTAIVKMDDYIRKEVSSMFRNF